MNEELQILILEDFPADAELVIRTLKFNNLKFASKIVHKQQDYIKALSSFSPDIILSDHQLPQFNSIDALKILKEKELNIPFILVTGTVSEEFAVTMIKEGADDYILKSNLTRLPNAIRSALHKKQAENDKEIYQTQLESKIKEINTFIYRISHDLKAPLASTIGIINLIRQRYDNNPILHYVDMIEKSNKKLESILMSFAEVVRISQETVSVEKFSLSELAEDIVQSLQNIPLAQGIRFDIQADPNIFFSGNKPILSSVLQNLIHNSIVYRKNISDSYIAVIITENNKFITIRITDNGIGIEETLLPKIFDMFFRATIASQGSGLGLYIVKNAVDKLGGTMSIESKLSLGTTFTIKLPKSK